MSDLSIKEKIQEVEKGNSFALVLGGPKVETYSRSPDMWNSVFRYNGIPSQYFAHGVEPEGLEEVVANILIAPKFRLSNITDPHKETMANIRDDRSNNKSSVSRTINATNTWSAGTGTLCRDSTDGYGAVKAIQIASGEERILENAEVLVLGAGGAGRAIALEYAREGARVLVANRSLEKAERFSKLAEQNFRVRISPIPLYTPEKEFTSEVLALLQNSGIVINTLPQEKNGEGEIFTQEQLSGSPGLRMDISYGPGTFFSDHCKNNGHTLISGLDMLLHQAIASFKIGFKKEISDIGIDHFDIEVPMKYALDMNLTPGTPYSKVCDIFDDEASNIAKEVVKARSRA